MSTEQKRARLLPCPFCGGPGERQSGGEGESRRYGCSCPNWKCVGHSSMLRHTNQRDAVDEWNRRAALQSQDREDAAQAEWMVDDGRAAWARNSLKDRIKEMRASEKRCRNAFRKDYMRVVSVYFADALSEAAEALERRLYAIDHARRIEGDGE